MCELLVRVVDKVNDTDPVLNARCTKRGDVIVVAPDGWAWGKAEIASREWAIVRVPNVSESEASSFLEPEIATDPSLPNLFLQSRGYRLDVDGLGIQGGGAITLDMDWPMLRNWRISVAPIDDQTVL